MAANNQAIFDPAVMRIGASFEAEETVDDDDDGAFGSASTSQVCHGFLRGIVKFLLNHTS